MIKGVQKCRIGGAKKIRLRKQTVKGYGEGFLVRKSITRGDTPAMHIPLPIHMSVSAGVMDGVGWALRGEPLILGDA